MLTKDDLKQIGEVMDDKLVDVLDAVNKGFTGMQTQFDGLKQDFSVLKQDVGGLKQDVGDLKKDVGDLKQDVSILKRDVTEIKAVMVTKDYLDEKLGALKGDLISYDRKLEKKTDVLVDALVGRRALSTSDVERLEQARVFPRIVS